MRNRTRLIAVLASTAVLVMGLDYITFAATGQGLILGRVNRADTTTTVTNTGPGPALSLKRSGAGGPALAIDSGAKIRHLNADRVDGVSASSLGTRSLSFRAGRRGTLVDGLRVWDTPVRPGNYLVSVEAVAVPNGADPGTPLKIVCGVVDVSTLGEETRIYAAGADGYVADFPAFMSAANVVRVRPGQRPGIVCTASDNASQFVLFGPVSASFTRIDSREVRRAEPVPVGRTARLVP